MISGGEVRAWARYKRQSSSVVGANVKPLPVFSCWHMVQVITAYLAGKKPQLEKAMQLLQGVRGGNIIVSYKVLSELMTACWNANVAEDADLVFQEMKAANYQIDSKVF